MYLSTSFINNLVPNVCVQDGNYTPGFINFVGFRTWWVLEDI